MRNNLFFLVFYSNTIFKELKLVVKEFNYNYCKFYILLVYILLSNLCYSQKEDNIWYFGIEAGLDFNSGSPIALNNGALIAEEGCSSISDSNGNIEFYTNGIQVINKSHTIMSNGTGLYGNMTTTQSAVIVPKPGSSSIYYIFTTDWQAHPHGLCYSEVDMSLSGGLGSVTNKKNIPLLTPTCEKITAIFHANNCYIWVLTHQYNSDAFYAYLVTSLGINTVPVISHSGTNIGGNIEYTEGNMKASPDGTHLALAHLNYNQVQLFNFNTATGAVNQPVTLGSNYSGKGPYGVEFSPSGQLLYITDIWGLNNIYQYNLNDSNIASSSIIVGSTGLYVAGALQLGPDNKIYIASQNNTSLSVINNPDKLGIGCNFIKDAISLAGKKSYYGLPAFIQNYFAYGFDFINICKGDNTKFRIKKFVFDSVLWNFGDTNSGAKNNSILFKPEHIFSDKGRFNVSLTIYYKGKSVVSSKIVTIIEINLNLVKDTTLCEGNSLLLDISTPNAYYLWQDSSTNAKYYITKPGMYSVKIAINGCVDADTIIVKYQSKPKIDLGNDTTICDNNSLLLNAATPNALYLWQDSSTSATYNVSHQGKYSVRVSVNGCSNTDSILVNYITKPKVDLGNDTAICEGKTILLNAATSNATYLWQDGSTNATYNVSQQGNYSVVVTNICGICSDSILVKSEICNCNLYIPNAFTPNGDALNNVFIPVSNCNFLKYNLMVFNRWGEKIFETSDENKGWDGMFNNHHAPVGVYIYLIKYTFITSTEAIKYGNITLLR